MPNPDRRQRSPSSASSSSNLSALLTDSDPALASLESQRLAELQASAARHAATNTSTTIAAVSPGHGTPALLTEPQAIQTTAAEARSLLLFTHADMAACARMQRHMTEVSRRDPGLCCVMVEAESAAWLAERMGIIVLPVFVGFLAGKEVGRLVGFEGLQGGLTCGVAEVVKVVKGWCVFEAGESESECEDGEGDEAGARKARKGRSKGRSIRSGGVRAAGRANDDDQDSDWD